MSNTQQNNIQNEIEQIKKEIDLLQDRLKNNEKSLNQFQNGLMNIIKRIRVKKDKGRIFLKPNKYKISLNIYCKIR